MSRAAASRSPLLGKYGVSAGINSSRAPSSFRLSRRLAERPASTSPSPADLAWWTWNNPAATSRLATTVSANSRPRQAARCPGRSPEAARSTDPLRVTAISASVALDLVQPEVHALQAEPHAHQVDDRLAPRRDPLIQLFGPVIIVGGALDLVLLRRQPPHVPRIPPQAVGAGAVAIAVPQQRFLAIAQRVAPLLRLLQGLVAFVHILKAVDIDARQAEFRIRRFGQQLLRLVELLHRQPQFLRAAMAGAVDARQMAFDQTELAADAILGVHRQGPCRHGARAFPLLLVD